MHRYSYSSSVAKMFCTDHHLNCVYIRVLPFYIISCFFLSLSFFPSSPKTLLLSLSLSLSTSDLLPNQNLSAFPITLGREKEKAQNNNNNRKNEKKAASNLLEWTRGKNKVIMIYRFVLQKKDKIQLSRVR